MVVIDAMCGTVDAVPLTSVFAPTVMLWSRPD